MRSKSLSLFVLSLAIGILLIGNPGKVLAEDVKLDGPTLQELVDQLFGTATTDGLLDGTQHFEFRAENVVLTEAQAALFFAPSPTNPADLTDLIAAAEGIKGANLRIEGTLDGDPFELKIAGKEVKAEGLVLTQAEFDALIAELKGIAGLKQVKIEATVDGKLLVLKMENTPGRVRIEDHSVRGKDAHLESASRGPGSDKGKPDARLTSSTRGERPERLEKIERPEKLERIERPERLEKIERIERPDVSRGGPGRG